jgi:hypothetical protein
MFQWGKHLGIKNPIFMLPDGNGDFTKAVGMLVKKVGFSSGYCLLEFFIISLFFLEFSCSRTETEISPSRWHAR